MRSSMKILVAAAATLLVAPQFAMAEDIEEQLRLMDERMGQLESQLQATQDELEASKTTVAAQQDLIEKAGLEREAQSGLSAFLSQTQFDGFVAASYTYNFIGTDVSRQDSNKSSVIGGTTDGINGGALGLTAPLHSNNNTFQVDQVWFGMRKPATAESRGGWAVDLVWGVGADYMGAVANNDDNAFATGDLPMLYQAYAEYLAPIGGDVSIKLGRFQTLIGAEVLRQDSNPNVTRGLLWTLQPENHTGVTIGSDYDNGATWTLGVANSYSSTMADADHEKTFIGQAGYRGETFAVLVNGLYGGNPSDLYGGTDGQARDSDQVGLIDLVVTADPMENLSLWANFDYYWFNHVRSRDDEVLERLNIYGIAVGSRWAFLDSTGLAIRFEWLRAEGHPLSFSETGIGYPGYQSQDLDMFEVTATLDHALTDNLTVRVEGRYDWAKDNSSSDNFFTTARPAGVDGYPDYTRQDQGMGLVELLYRF